MSIWLEELVAIMSALGSMTMSLGLIPSLVPICLKDQKNALRNIKFFRKQWKRCCIVTGMDEIAEEIKYNVLLTIMGEETINLIKILDIPSGGERNTELILPSLEDYFIPSANCKNTV